MTFCSSPGLAGYRRHDGFSWPISVTLAGTLSIIGLLKAPIQQSLFLESLAGSLAGPGAQVLGSFVADLSEYGGPGFMADTPAGARPVTEILPQPFSRANLARDR
jgi:hypothetical protein